jgi:hypothetical protein
MRHIWICLIDGVLIRSGLVHPGETMPALLEKLLQRYPHMRPEAMKVIREDGAIFDSELWFSTSSVEGPKPEEQDDVLAVVGVVDGHIGVNIRKGKSAEDILMNEAQSLEDHLAEDVDFGIFNFNGEQVASIEDMMSFITPPTQETENGGEQQNGGPGDDSKRRGRGRGRNRRRERGPRGRRRRGEAPKGGNQAGAGAKSGEGKSDAPAGEGAIAGAVAAADAAGGSDAGGGEDQEYDSREAGMGDDDSAQADLRNEDGAGDDFPDDHGGDARLDQDRAVRGAREKPPERSRHEDRPEQRTHPSDQDHGQSNTGDHAEGGERS